MGNTRIEGLGVLGERGPNSVTVSKGSPESKGEIQGHGGFSTFCFFGWDGLGKSRMGVPVRRGIGVWKVDPES